MSWVLDSVNTFLRASSYRGPRKAKGAVRSPVADVTPLVATRKYETIVDEPLRFDFELPFTLLADEGHAVADAYGSWVEKNNYGKTYWGTARRTFLARRVPTPAAPLPIGAEAPSSTKVFQPPHSSHFPAI